ncbi:hypothetical protein [Halobacillus ihumii]|uniref:hypothetical protein n=1 Tax=Halobacillus ihumii TaxID=2686092 RepID=UPI0013D5AF93|nr:hypothetical protein [Halobacillus ihumii]
MNEAIEKYLVGKRIKSIECNGTVVVIEAYEEGDSEDTFRLTGDLLHFGFDDAELHYRLEKREVTVEYEEIYSDT